MISALDTNVLLDILIPNERFFDRSVGALEAAAGAGPLVICDLVYAELQLECDRFLAEKGNAVERMSRQVPSLHAWLQGTGACTADNSRS